MLRPLRNDGLQQRHAFRPPPEKPARRSTIVSRARRAPSVEQAPPAVVSTYLAAPASLPLLRLSAPCDCRCYSCCYCVRRKCCCGGCWCKCALVQCATIVLLRLSQGLRIKPELFVLLSCCNYLGRPWGMAGWVLAPWPRDGTLAWRALSMPRGVDRGCVSPTHCAPPDHRENAPPGVKPLRHFGSSGARRGDTRTSSVSARSDLCDATSDGRQAPLWVTPASDAPPAETPIFASDALLLPRSASAERGSGAGIASSAAPHQWEALPRRALGERERPRPIAFARRAAPVGSTRSVPLVGRGTSLLPPRRTLMS